MASELSTFFPTALHPAIPVAVKLLSTLRNLTAPGKGNDIRAEERAALVGVSALLACEKVHSKDLIERTAQKASSVAPIHFRSALQRARQLLSSLPDEEVSSGTSRRRSSSRTRSTPEVGTSSESAVLAKRSGAASSSSAQSPFSTPKKKFKFSSGIDISGLIKHSPSKGSPLKQSVTPRATHREAEDLGLGNGVRDEAEEEQEEDVIGTPTKVRHAVDSDSAAVIYLSGPSTSTSKRKRDDEDMAAFFALRPGEAGSRSPADITSSSRFKGFSDSDAPSRPRPARPERSEADRRRRKLRKKRDWTFRETIWGGVTV